MRKLLKHVSFHFDIHDILYHLCTVHFCIGRIDVVGVEILI